jgi:ubiquinone/menaquinone biosynthesis C-methylase UbiE
MKIQDAYTLWSLQYDTNSNRTRDLEAQAVREVLKDRKFENSLEVGCGTGKNTIWLQTITTKLTALDFSPGMLAIAKEKVKSEAVLFVQADIKEDWDFSSGNFDLITFSLVLEHVDELEPVIEKAFHHLRPGGLLYIGELHPFKQYEGVKARFDTEAGRTEVDCFKHHVTDFLNAGEKAGFKLLKLGEHFDGDDRQGIPRILALLMEKP